MNAQIVVVAKEPLPGRVKTRLCPPCTPQQAARLADAALADTIEVVTHTPATRRVLLLDGTYPVPEGWEVTPQRGNGLAQRLANGLVASFAMPTLLIGMDTPHVTADLLEVVVSGLSDVDAMLAPAEDGGWWALALRDPRDAVVLEQVPMSRSDTAELTRQALTRQGLSVGYGPYLRDVDTFADVSEVAALCPGSRFAAVSKELE